MDVTLSPMSTPPVHDTDMPDKSDPEVASGDSDIVTTANSGTTGSTAALGACTEQASSSYADALRERLKRIRAEVEAQGAVAVSTRQNIVSTRTEVEAHRSEAARLRSQWAAEQPRRSALLHETGEVERKVAEQEGRCAEVLAAQVAVERAPSPQPPLPASTVCCGSINGNVNENESQAPSADHGDGAVSSSSRQSSQRLLDQRQRLLTLEETRTELTAKLRECRNLVHKEGAEIQQLVTRRDGLRKETRALRAGAEAAREGESRVRRKLDALDSTVQASQQREHALERQVVDIRNEVQSLRLELTAACNAVGSAFREGTDRRTPTAHPQPGDSDAHAWATNRRLQAKVIKLQQEFRKKQEVVRGLREQLAGDGSVEVVD